MILFEYKSEQKTLEIGGTRIGGIPGLVPTVIIGSIFYSSDKVVIDAEKGDFDKSKTENLLNMLADISERTGIPTMLDVVATSSSAIEKYLRYLVDMTDFPLLIDGSDSTEVNTAGIRMAKEAGLMDRVILNSLTPDSKEELYSVVKETGLQNALLLAFSTQAMTSATKRVELADGLVEKAQQAGITNIIIDTGVMDLLTLGLACRAQHMIKSKYGFPVGNGAHNAISTWQGLVPKFGKDAKKPAMVGSNLMPVTLGADFVMMGPAKYAPIVYPSVAMIDVALSGIHIETRTKPEKPHPRYLIS